MLRSERRSQIRMAVSGIRDSLKQRGVRLTRQRQILLDLIDQSGAHLDAEALYQLAKEKDSKLNRVTAFFKATSYMTHKPEFSLIRDQVLAHGGAVLEDDSGIPYHFFREQSWKVQLYGAYVRPYGSFKWMQQPDLKKAFTTSETRPLKFRIGYGFGKIESNLILARKE